jgi:hypothetical protein
LCTTLTELTKSAHIFILVLCWAAQEETAQRCDALGEPVPYATTIAATHHEKQLTATATAIAPSKVAFADVFAAHRYLIAACAHSKRSIPHETVSSRGGDLEVILDAETRAAHAVGESRINLEKVQERVERFTAVIDATKRWRAEAA